MKLTVLFFSDTHLGFDYTIHPRINVNRRGEDFYNNFKLVVKHALELKPDLVVHGGDYFYRSQLPEDIVGRGYQELIPLLNAGIPTYILPGNHERATLPDSPLFRHDKLFLFDRPREYVSNVQNTRVVLRGFPYVGRGINHEFAALSAFEDKDQNALRLLCVHELIEGSRVGPVNHMFRSGPDVLGMNRLPYRRDCAAVLAGHVHRSQILRFPGRSPVIYPGSTERTSFAEQREEKGFFVLHFDKPHGVWRVETEFIPLPARPMEELVFNYKSEKNMAADIKHRLEALPANAVVVFACSVDMPMKLRNMLSLAYVRSLAPATMNVVMKYRRLRSVGRGH